MSQQEQDWFDKLNQSELVELALEVFSGAHRGLLRTELVRIITNGESDLPETRGVDRVRLEIMRYVDANYEQVKPLLSCPARSRDIRACFQCLDYQVLECALKSEATLKLGLKK
jgi:hypothetical protein